MLAEAWRKASRQNIVLLTFGQLRNSVSSLQRSLGLLAGIGSELNRGISYRVEETADTGIEDGYQAAKRLFSGKTPPDAIFCVGDLLGLGVLEYLNEQGIACPKQVSVVGGCGNLDGAMQHGSRPFSNHSATIRAHWQSRCCNAIALPGERRRAPTGLLSSLRLPRGSFHHRRGEPAAWVLIIITGIAE